jgi:hypothetical protein
MPNLAFSCSNFLLVASSSTTSPPASRRSGTRLMFFTVPFFDVFFHSQRLIVLMDCHINNCCRSRVHGIRGVSITISDRRRGG